jgi:hypothetical protein
MSAGSTCGQCYYVLVSQYTSLPMGVYGSLEAAKRAGYESDERVKGDLEVQWSVAEFELDAPADGLGSTVKVVFEPTVGSTAQWQR